MIVSGAPTIRFAENLDERIWEPFRDGTEVSWLYRNGAHGPAAAYPRYARGARAPRHWHAGHENVFVLEGSQSDHNGTHVAGSLVVNEPGSAHETKWLCWQSRANPSLAPNSLLNRELTGNF